MTRQEASGQARALLPWGSIPLLECVCGSRGYGLQTESSDWDIHGVFVLSPDQAALPGAPDQVNSSNNDCCYWEIRKFLGLIAEGNPSAMELLAACPEDTILRNPLMDLTPVGDFISKRSARAFLGFATKQLRKARGTNKKIFNPMPRERKTPTDFCYVLENGGSTPLKDFMIRRGLQAACCGLVSSPNAKGCHALYYDVSRQWSRGIVSEEDGSGGLRCSSVPKGTEPLAVLYFNEDAFKKHCVDHKEYWHWVSHRNEERYQTNMQHGGGFDSKNMSHMIRLLLTARDLAAGKGLVVKRVEDREHLLAIKAGLLPFESIMEEATALESEVTGILESCSLPDKAEVGTTSILKVIYQALWRVEPQ